jgi:RHS repeat-associated protein
LNAGASSAAVSETLDTERTFAEDGLEMRTERGPLHQVKLSTGGAPVSARRLTTVEYNPAPNGDKPHLPTRTTVKAEGGGATDAEQRVTTTEYDWALRKPTATIVDSDTGGLQIKNQTSYNASTGLAREGRMPKSETGTDAGVTQTVYYSADNDFGDGLSDSACANRPEWANLPCKTKPAAQPGTPGLPDLPVTTFEYNRLQQVTKSTETVGNSSRISTTSYDAAGRKQSESTTASGPSGGTPVPDGLVGAWGFDEGSGSTVDDRSEAGNDGSVSGAAWSSSGKFGGALSFDGTNDRVVVPDSASLDLDDEMTLEAWVKPTSVGGDFQTVALKEWGDYLVYGLEADDAGKPWGAAYMHDADSLVSAGGPSALAANTWAHLAVSYDGSQIKVYVNGSEVASEPASGPIETSGGDLSIGGTAAFADQWFDGLIDEVRVYNRALTTGEIQNDKDTPIADLTAEHTDEVDYSYDAAGRLAQVEDDPANSGCTTRTYTYDKNSNRLTRTVRAPLAGGACDTTGSGQVQSSNYDSADRLSTSGAVYDPFGRMTAVPASHSGGGVLQSTYYVNDMVRSQSQDGQGKTWLLDPTLTRHRGTAPVGGNQEILHYIDDSDIPAWSEQLTNGTATGWTRNIEGIDGDLVAVHDTGSGTTELEITNLHGDVIATARLNPNATAPSPTIAFDEFGNPTASGTRRYGWHGAQQRRTALSSGVIQMGVRSYVPDMGRFTSVDPVPGGSANTYDYANQDPVNQSDLGGDCGIACIHTPDDLNDMLDHVNGKNATCAAARCGGDKPTPPKKRKPDPYAPLIRFIFQAFKYHDTVVVEHNYSEHIATRVTIGKTHNTLELQRPDTMFGWHIRIGRRTPIPGKPGRFTHSKGTYYHFEKGKLKPGKGPRRR